MEWTCGVLTNVDGKAFVAGAGHFRAAKSLCAALTYTTSSSDISSATLDNVRAIRAAQMDFAARKWPAPATKAFPSTLVSTLHINCHPQVSSFSRMCASPALPPTADLNRAE